MMRYLNSAIHQGLVVRDGEKLSLEAIVEMIQYSHSGYSVPEIMVATAELIREGKIEADGAQFHVPVSDATRIQRRELVVATLKGRGWTSCADLWDALWNDHRLCTRAVDAALADAYELGLLMRDGTRWNAV